VKTLIYGLLALIVIALGGALVAPSFVDWNQYKPEIIAQASKATGREIAIDGPIALAVLPVPTLSVGGVRIANLDGAGTADMVRLTSLEVRVALVPLLSGAVEVESVVLVEPEVVLEKLADGRVNWSFGAVASESSGRSEGAAAAAGALSVTLDQVSIESGTLIYRDAGARLMERIGDINLEISARSLTGPYTIQGSLAGRGVPLTVDVAVGEMAAGKPLVVKADLGADGVRLAFSGSIRTGDSDPSVTGKIQFGADDLGALAKIIGTATGQAVTMPLSVDRPVSLDGRIELTGQNLGVSEVKLRLGDMVASGEGAIGLGAAPTFDLAMAVNRLDLDALLADMPDSLDDTAEATPPAGSGAKDDAEPTVVDGFRLPVNLTGTVELTAEAVLYNGQVMRQAVVSANMIAGILNLQRVSALLPGGSDLTVFGSVDWEKGTPRLIGQIEAVSDNLRAMLEWLEIDVAAVPADRLRKFGFSANINGSPDFGSITDVDLQLDASRLVGGIAYVLRAGRPGFGVTLRLDRFNADAYLPATTADANNDGAAGDADSAGAGDPPPTQSAAALAFLNTFDADFEIRIDNLTYRDIPISGLLLDGLLQYGTLNLHQASVGEVAGASASLSGTLTGLDGLPAIDGAISLRTENLSALAHAIPAIDLLPSALTGALGIETKILGDLDSMTIDGTFAALDSELKLKGTVANPTANPTFDMEARLSNPNLAQLLASLGVVESGPAANALAGPILLTAKAAGGIGGFDVDAAATLAGNALDVSGRIDGLPDAAVFNLSGRANHASLAALLEATVGYDAAQAPPALAAPFAVTATAAGSLDRFDIETTAATGETTIAARGQVGGLPDAPSYDLAAEVADPSLTALLQGLGVSQSLAGFEGPLRVSAQIGGNPALVSLPRLEATLGKSTLVGSLSVALDGPRPKIGADLITGAVVAEHFLAPAALATKPADGGGEAGAGGTPVPSTGERWSRTAIDFSGLKAVDAEVKIAADSLSYGGYRFDDAELALRIDDAVLTVDQLSGRAFDGDINLQAALDARSLPRLDLSFSVAGADLRQALNQMAQLDLITGRLGMEAALTASGQSQYALISSLNGTGRVGSTAGGGTIDGIDLRALSDRLDNLDQIGDFLNLAKASFERGQTRYSEFRGSFTMTNGELGTNDLRLIADGGVGEVVGIVDLPSWTQDVTAMFRLTDHPEAPPIGVRLTGALDQPRRDIKTAEIEQYLLSRGLGAVIQKAVPAEKLGAAAPLLDNLLGGGGGGSAAGALIEGLLGGGEGTGQPAPAARSPAPAPTPAPAPAPAPSPAPASAPAPLPAETEAKPEQVFKTILDNLLDD
jgi:uncharacterized protein involved in outer membrane biogenesis